LFSSVAAVVRDRAGISSLEYAVMALGVLGAVVAAAIALGSDIATFLVNLGNAIRGMPFP
jgi:Flp pilus assembly pilin Flp